MKRPNILFIMSDQEQHWSLLPPGLSRPGLEWLLERGTGFANHHVVTLPCGPSRSTIYTGQHTQHTKVFGNPSRARGIGMSPDVATVGRLLREHGYHTVYKGKWHVSVIDPPTPFVQSTVDSLEEFGFSDFNPTGDPVGVGWDGFRHDPAVASDAANWLLGLGGAKPVDQPWFLAVNFVNPHDIMYFDATGRMNEPPATAATPRLPAPRSDVYSRDWDVDLPASFGDDLSAKPSIQAELAKVVAAGLGEIPHDDEGAWRAYRSYYYNCLRDLDRHVRTVLDAFAESGHDRDTVVVYTTDHGEAAGAHGLREKPTSLYREVVNVPLVVCHPDVAGGSTTSALSSAIDLLPTVLSLAGVSAVERGERYPGLTGHDLSPVVAAPAARTTRDATGVLFNMSRPMPALGGREELARGGDPRRNLRGVFDGKWKYGRYFGSEDLSLARGRDDLVTVSDLELYDTAADPDEVHNLAADERFGGELDRLEKLVTELVDAEVGTDYVPGASSPDSA